MNGDVAQILRALGRHELQPEEAFELIAQRRGDSAAAPASVVDRRVHYDQPDLRDHLGTNPFDGKADTRVLLGVIHCSLSVQALADWGTELPLRVSDLRISAPVLLQPGEEGRISVHREEGDRFVVRYGRTNEEPGQEVAAGRFPRGKPPAAGLIDVVKIAEGWERELAGEELYDTINTRRGPSLRAVQRAWVRASEAVGALQLDDDDDGYLLHPKFLDGAYICGMAALRAAGVAVRTDGVWIPFGVQEATVYASLGSSCRCHVSVISALDHVMAINASLCDPTGRVLATIRGLTCRFIAPGGTAEQRSAAPPAAVVPVQPSGKAAGAGRDTGGDPDLRDLVSDYLRAKIQQVVGVEDLPSVENFMAAGIASNDLIVLVGEIEADLGVELYPTLFFEYQNLSELVTYFLVAHGDVVRAQWGSDLRTAEPVAGESAVPGSLGRGSREPDSDGRAVAIVGMAGRFAGSMDVEGFWSNLVSGVNLISEVPPDRWDWREWFDEDRSVPHRTYARWGSFIDADRFDPAFFGIAPREAVWLDPQLRLLLEVIYEAFEDAGYASRIRGTRTGLYVGVSFPDHWSEIVRTNTPLIDYQGNSSVVSVLAGRISYVFDLQGPCVPVDNACASSLTALHLAVRAVRTGECDTAVAAGVNLLLSPLHYITVARLEALSPTGRCRSFSADADGYVPGEGVAALLVKPLERAVADGDRVLAVVRGSAVNHTGRASSPTAPRPELQARVLREAWADAGIFPDSLSYIEAHGTGTLLGDPVEVSALRTAFGPFTDRSGFCVLGSVKAHVGHLEAAAGIAGVVKTVLQMRYGRIPVMPTFTEPNPYLDLDRSPFVINNEPVEWPAVAGRRRRAGVSSFGMSGNNVHVVLEDYPEPAHDRLQDDRPHILVLSARTSEQLIVHAGRIAEHLKRHRPALAGVARTLQAREAMDHRLAVVADTLDTAIDLLTAYLTAPEDRLPDGVWRATCPPGRDAVQVTAHATTDPAGLVRYFTDGADIDWTPLWHERPVCLLSLPPYPFTPQRYRMPAPTMGPGGPKPPDQEIHLLVPGWADCAAASDPAQPPGPVLVVGRAAERDAARRVLGAAAVAEADLEDLATFGDADRLFRDAARGGARGVLVVLSAAGGDLDTAATGSVLRPLITMVQALARAVDLPLMRVVVVAGRDRGPADPHVAALAGLGRSLAVSAPHLDFSFVEVVGVQDPAAWIRAGMGEWGRSGCSEVRLANRRRSRPTLERAPARAADGPVTLRQGAVVLIAGGLGGLGRAVATRLAATHAARLVLAGRSPSDSETDRWLADLRRAGAREAVYHTADLTDPNAVDRLVAAVRARFGGLNAVVHAAGVLDEQGLPDKDWDAAWSVLAPKVVGLALLDAATFGEPLDLFAIFSSASSALGDYGQGDYAVASRFADVFGAWREDHRRRGSRNGRTVVIDWGLWRDGGMHLGTASEERYLASSGLEYLHSEPALDAFERLLQVGLSQVLVLAGPETAINRLITTASWPPGPTTQPDTEPADGSVPEAVARALRSELCDIAADVLHSPSERLDADESLNAFGFDSISVKEFAGRVGEVLGVRISPTSFFTEGNLRAISAYILARHGAAVRARYVTKTTDTARVTPVPAVPAQPAGEEHARRPGTAGLGTEPIAIVGAAATLPGSEDVARFWNNLLEGRDLVGEIPLDRWDWREVFSEDPLAPGRTRSRWGAFLTGVDRFDAAFFKISPREAELMDPQQRLLLQVAWSALEDAGWRVSGLAGRRIGVFVGAQFTDYHQLLQQAGIQQVQVGTGNALNMLANRVSYTFDLRGPSEVVDTACSSSLIAVHRAVTSIQSGDCDAAIVGGVSLILTPYNFVLSNEAGVFSPTGRCRSFDAAADGYVRGEGVVALVLKPLSAAVRDGDQVYAVIRGSAVNHGGRSSSPTAPNLQAQAEVVADAWERAEVSPASVSYLETHGTGTQLGDPIEVHALRCAVELWSRRTGQPLPTGRWCAIGTVKTHLGHLEPAAGITGLLTVALTLRHGVLPGMLHQREENPLLELESSPFYLADQARPWEARPGARRRAGVSSFGFGGSNAHLVVEEYPQPEPGPDAPAVPQVVVLSARDEPALRRYAAHLAGFLRQQTAQLRDLAPPQGEHRLPRLVDVAYTLQIGRVPMPERLAVVTDDRERLAGISTGFASGETAGERHRGSATAGGTLAESLVSGRAGQEYLRALADEGDWDQLARLWVCGVDVDWTMVRRGSESPRRISLPTYPFAPDRHWFTDGHGAFVGSSHADDAGTAAGPVLPDLYVPRWVLAQDVMDGGAPTAAAPSPGGPVWILHDRAGAPLAAALAARHNVRRVRCTELPGLDVDTELAEIGIPAEVYFLSIHRPPSGAIDLNELQTAQEQGLMALLRLVKALSHGRASAPRCQLTVVTRGVHGPAAEALPVPYAAGLHALAKTIAKEHPAWRVRAVDVAIGDIDLNAIAARLADPAGLPADHDLCLDRERCYVRRFQPLELQPPSSDGTAHNGAGMDGLPLRRGGVYLIVGGASGIGRELAKHLAMSVQATVVVLGRSARAAPQCSAEEELRRLGGDGLYLQADVTDPTSLRAAVQQVNQRFGKIHGVVHSALVLHDQTLDAIDEGSFTEVLAPKVRGSVVLCQELVDQPLDFVLFFSSAQSFVGSAGQGNYAAACAFQDAYARYLRSMGWPVTVINWGFWGSVGVVSTEEHVRRMAAQGVFSIEPEEGIAAMRAVLAQALPQVLAVKSDPKQLREILAIADRAVRPAGKKTVLVPTTVLTSPASDRPEPDPAELARLATGWQELEEYCADLILELFRSADLLTTPGQRYTRSDLAIGLGVVPAYQPLVHAFAGVLVESGLLVPDGSLLRTTATVTDPRLRARLGALSERGERIAATHPSLEPHIRLLDSCRARYREVLTGAVPAQEVLFPGGLSALISPVYQGDAVTDQANRLVAWCLSRFAPTAGRASGERLAMLEVGAGTGATTVHALAALEGHEPQPDYLATDLCQAFVRYGQETYGARHDFVRCAPLDIERDPITQGFTEGSFDVVVATNVLHATRDIEVSLANVKRLLRPGGWLVLNEGTRTRTYATLIFGLTDGWWRPSDTYRRIPGSPLLDRAGWERMVRSAGFDELVTLDPTGEDPKSELAHQAVFIAVSDGLIPMEPFSPDGTDVPPSRTWRDLAEASGASARDVSTTVEDTVRSAYASVLHVDSEAIDRDAANADLGVDSVMAIQIANRISGDLQIPLRSTDLFNYATLGRLVSYIMDEHEADLRSLTGATPAEVAVPGEEMPPPTLPVSPAGAPGCPPAHGSVRGIGTLPLAGRTPDRADASEIAVIGMSGRFPDAGNLDQFWRNLASGRSSITEVTRWDPADFYDPDPQRVGKSYSRWGALLEDIDRFDPLFFNISPKEAELMDPQQRVLLEEAWRAVEDAGYSRADLNGSRCGVYVGFNGNDYLRTVEESGPPGAYAFMGNNEAILAARLSYLFDLKGPCITVNTACSSSLVAVHLACEAIRSGVADTALAAGVMIMTTPLFYQLASRTGMLSPTGACYTFDERADGFVPGEGVGVIMVKSLPAALRDGDHIYGVIAGSGINQDGQTSGITAPCGPSQTALETEIYDRFRIDPADITYVEAHGTGTRLGDPIEVEALTAAFRRYTDKIGYCAIGSVKTNIGHTLATAGMAGLLKVLLSLRNGTLVPSVNFERPNAMIPFDSSPFCVNTECRPWPSAAGRPRYGAVSSFGFSGTNAHLVVREAVETPERPEPSARPYHLVALSGHTEAALRTRIADLTTWLEAGGAKYPLRDISYTTTVGRTHLAHRVAYVVRDTGELAEALPQAPHAVDHKRGGTPHEAGADAERATVLLHTAGRSPRVPDHEFVAVLNELAELYLRGANLPWADLYSGELGNRLALPTYPFAGNRYRIAAPAAALEGADGVLHPLVEYNCSTLHEQRFGTRLRRGRIFVDDHVVEGIPTLPGAACIEMARIAGELATEASVAGLRNIVWMRPLRLQEPRALHIAIGLVEQHDGDMVEFELRSADDGEISYAKGRLLLAATPPERPAPVVDVAAVMARCRQRLDVDACYAMFEAAGLHYGPSFRTLRLVHCGVDEALAELLLPASADVDGLLLNPALLDGALQAVAGLQGDLTHHDGRPYLPFSLRAIDIYQETRTTRFAHVRVAGDGAGSRRFDVALLDEHGTVLVSMREITMREMRGQAPTVAEGEPSHHGVDDHAWIEELLYRLRAGDIDVAAVKRELENT